MGRFSESIMISLLIASRRNDKFLAKLMMSILVKTKSLENVEILIMANGADEWNRDLFSYLKKLRQPKITIEFEQINLGRYGLDQYFNKLAELSTGDWLWYLCSDHDIIYHGYDEFLLADFKERGMSPTQAWIVTPGMKDVGPISHIISRGWYNIAGRVAGQCFADSWCGDVGGRLRHQERYYRMSGVQVMTDYTPRTREILSPEDSLVPVEKPEGFLENNAPEYQDAVNAEVAKMDRAIEEGR